MAYHNVVFPTNISYGSSGGPEFSTEIIIFGSGHEQRNANWEAHRCKFKVVWDNHLAEFIPTLLAFFRARSGMAHSFPYKDWSDYQGTGEIIGTGDDAEKTFQLVKTYNSYGYTDYVRDITKPKTGTTKIYLDGVLASGWSIDLLTGIVTFSSAPATDVVITADYEFYVPVRFDTDCLQISIDIRNIHTMPDVDLVEVRV